MEKPKKLLIQLTPKNELSQLTQMIDEFSAYNLKLEGGILSVPSNYTFITKEDHLLIVLPDRIDFLIALEPTEYLIIADS